MKSFYLELLRDMAKDLDVVAGNLTGDREGLNSEECAKVCADIAADIRRILVHIKTSQS